MGKKQVILFLTLIVASTAFITGMFHMHCQSSEEKILNLWQNTTAQTAVDVNYYLTMPMDAVSISARTINDMSRKARLTRRW